MKVDLGRLVALVGASTVESLPIEYPALGRGRFIGDPVVWEAAEAIGIPESLAKAVKIVDPARASLQDFLSAYLALPVATDGALQLALFAAACIVAGPEFGLLIRPPRGDVSPTAHLDRLADRAKQWLDEELPRRAFSPQVEALIDDVIRLPVGGTR